MPRTSRFLALIAAVALVAAACGGGGNGKSQQAQSAALQRGGVVKNGLVPHAHEALDPARGYYTTGWGILPCCLTRDPHGLNPEGPPDGRNTHQPDLRTALP